MAGGAISRWPPVGLRPMMHGMDTIVVPVDFSDASGRLLDAAEAEARRRGAKVLLLHVIEPAAEVAGFETDPQMMRLRIGQSLEDEKRVEAARLKEMAASLHGRGLDCEASVKFGLPADEIVALAKENEAALVVVGSHGHGALYHLFAGSVVTGVLRQTGCPVLVVPLRQVPKK